MTADRMNDLTFDLTRQSLAQMLAVRTATATALA
jgi:hypothetical protein